MIFHMLRNTRKTERISTYKKDRIRNSFLKWQSKSRSCKKVVSKMCTQLVKKKKSIHLQEQLFCSSGPLYIENMRTLYLYLQAKFVCSFFVHAINVRLLHRCYSLSSNLEASDTQGYIVFAVKYVSTNLYILPHAVHNMLPPQKLTSLQICH